MKQASARDFPLLVKNALLFPAQVPKETDRAISHMGRYITILDMVRRIALPDMRVVDVASFGTILPALRRVLGFRDVTVTGPPLDGQETHGELRCPPMPDGEILTCPFDRFDLEGPFPYEDGIFDLIIFTEVLEHLTCDPMHIIGEINRITRVGGWLLLQTPNCCSLRTVGRALRGLHPYHWSQYSKGGDRDRHNREYTPDEVRRLLEYAGYEIKDLITRNDSYGAAQTFRKRCLKWLGNRALALASLAAGHYVTPAMRGEATFALARKVGPVKSRFPAFLYY